VRSLTCVKQQVPLLFPALGSVGHGILTLWHQSSKWRNHEAKSPTCSPSVLSPHRRHVLPNRLSQCVSATVANPRSLAPRKHKFSTVANMWRTPYVKARASPRQPQTLRETSVAVSQIAVIVPTRIPELFKAGMGCSVSPGSDHPLFRLHVIVGCSRLASVVNWNGCSKLR
jgi:hypothetical protein